VLYRFPLSLTHFAEGSQNCRRLVNRLESTGVCFSERKGVPDEQTTKERF